MDDYGTLVAAALLAPDGSTAREDAERQMTCKLQASHRIQCACGSILDQSTISVLELSGETIVVCCPACRRRAEEYIPRLIADTGMHPGDTLTWITWDAAQVVDPAAKPRCVKKVPGLAVVRQPNVSRGPGKYRVVHVASDTYLAEPSTLRDSRQLLAQLKDLADWSLPKAGLLASLDAEARENIKMVVQHFS